MEGLSFRGPASVGLANDMFNSLEAIRRLCRKDPAQADAALLKFGRYLRVSGFVRKPCDRLRLAEEFAHLRYAAT